jgi:hypothetical protein
MFLIKTILMKIISFSHWFFNIFQYFSTKRNYKWMFEN